MRGSWTTLSLAGRTTSFSLEAVLLAVLVACASSRAYGQVGAAVPNWAAARPSPTSGMHTMGDVTNALPFIGVTPCRIVDTRGAAGPYGGPAISPGSPRSFALLGGPCTGLPNAVAAYSLNITAVNPTGTGFVKVFPQGGASPVVSTLNFAAGQTVANAAVVAAGTGGGITLAAAATTDVLVDINGYFSNGSSALLLNPGERFEVAGTNDTAAILAGRNDSDANGAVGVSGIVGGTGRNFGVQGRSTSLANNSAGVKGIDFSGGAPGAGFGITAGVRGESSSGGGVYGRAQQFGVVGENVDSTGTVQSRGILGESATFGVYATGDIGASGMKLFVEPHPTDASKVIRYVALEGGEAGTYFRGSARTSSGRAMIEVPESFRIVTDEEGLTVQLTPIGDLAMLAVTRKDLNQIVVRSSKDVAFDYLVHGVRRAFKNFQPIGQGEEYMPLFPSDRMPAYLTEEAKRRLIANGTYNADGTVNMGTAERVGWTKIWAEREALAKATAEKARQASPSSK